MSFLLKSSSISRNQISLHDGTLRLGKGATFGASTVLQTACSAIAGASDLFVSLSRSSADVPAYFKLFLVESFACTLSDKYGI